MWGIFFLISSWIGFFTHLVAQQRFQQKLCSVVRRKKSLGQLSDEHRISMTRFFMTQTRFFMTRTLRQFFLSICHLYSYHGTSWNIRIYDSSPSCIIECYLICTKCHNLWLIKKLKIGISHKWNHKRHLY